VPKRGAVRRGTGDTRRRSRKTATQKRRGVIGKLKQGGGGLLTGLRNGGGEGGGHAFHSLRKTEGWYAQGGKGQGKLLLSINQNE